MSGLAIAAGVVGVAGAGASIYGASQQPSGVDTGSIPVTGFNPYANPLLSSLAMNAGAGIGNFDENTYRQASPIQQLLATAQSTGNMSRDQYMRLQEALKMDPQLIQQAKGLTGKAKKDFKKANNISNEAMAGLKFVDRLAQTGGYKSSDELFAKNQEYLGKLPSIQAQYQPVADQLRKGLLSSQGRIGQYLQDLPNLLTGEANPFIDQLRNEALTSSQKYGYNPYQGLEQARSQALTRALQLIQGEQAVQAGQQQAALPVAQLQQQGGASAAQLGAGQAQMLAGALQSQQAAQSAQSQSWGNLGGSLMGLSAGAFGQLGPAVGGGGGGAPPGAGNYGSSPNNYATAFSDI